LFPVRAFKRKMEIRVGGGALELGNPGGRGALAVWKIQSEGGSKLLAIRRGGGGYFFWNNPISLTNFTRSFKESYKIFKRYSSKIFKDPSKDYLRGLCKIVTKPLNIVEDLSKNLCKILQKIP